MCSSRRQARLAIPLVPLALLAAVACRKAPPVREFAVVGQVVAIDSSTNYVTLRHEDIKGFMPGMTMPFAVKDPALLEGKVPGDLVAATLQVQNTDAWITRLTKTGSAPLPPRAETPVPGLAPGDRVPDQTFVDQGGGRLTMEWGDGHVAVVTFIYTRCPFQDFCPAIDRRFVELQDAIKGASGSSGSLADVRLLSVSIDPAFDRPAVLKAHASKLGADPKVWRFVTAPPAEITAFGRQFGLDVRQSGPAPADIEHNLRTVVLDRNRRIVETRTGSDWTAADLLARLRTVAGA
jgi:protein SCO1/2